MPISVEYILTDEDGKEAIGAQTAFFAKKPIKSKKRFTLGWIIGGRHSPWLLFVFMAVPLFFISQKFFPDVGQRIPGAPEIFSRNARPTLVAVCIGPFFFIAFMSWAMSLTVGVSAGRVPYFAPKQDGRRRPRLVWRSVAILNAIAWIMAFGELGSADAMSDWRPGPGAMNIVNALGWGGCFLLLTLAGTLGRRYGRGLLGYAESSIRLPQRLDASDGGLSLANASVRYDLSWPYFASYLESDNLLILYTRDLTIYLVPKRAFKDELSLFRFCSLLQNHIPAGQFLPRASGFPVAVLPLESVGENKHAN